MPCDTRSRGNSSRMIPKASGKMPPPDALHDAPGDHHARATWPAREISVPTASATSTSTSTRSLPYMSPSRPRIGVATEAREQVGGEDPADARLGGVQGALDVRQRGDHQRLHQGVGHARRHQHRERHVVVLALDRLHASKLAPLLAQGSSGVKAQADARCPSELLRRRPEQEPAVVGPDRTGIASAARRARSRPTGARHRRAATAWRASGDTGSGLHRASPVPSDRPAPRAGARSRDSRPVMCEAACWKASSRERSTARATSAAPIAGQRATAAASVRSRTASTRGFEDLPARLDGDRDLGGLPDPGLQQVTAAQQLAPGASAKRHAPDEQALEHQQAKVQLVDLLRPERSRVRCRGPGRAPPAAARAARPRESRLRMRSGSCSKTRTDRARVTAEAAPMAASLARTWSHDRDECRIALRCRGRL